MKYAVCVLAHSKPDLLERIVSKLAGDQVEVYVHLDKKSDISQFSHIRGAVFIPNRVKVYWGGRSMVVAMYNLIDHVLTHSQCDYLLFISGEDYPLVSPEMYDQYIDPCMNYIEYDQLPRNDWGTDGINRVSHYYVFNYRYSLLSRLFIKLQKVLGITRDVQKLGYVLYGGSQWVNLSRMAAVYIRDHWDQYYDFLKYSHIPDEMLFQTILMNSPYRDTVVNNNLRFVYFMKNSRNPVYLNEVYYSNIMRSRALFCRKVLDIESFKKLEAFFVNHEG